jgi:DNA-directed RNA polymerase delta subunit
MKIEKIPKEELELLSYTEIAKLYLEETKKTMNTADLFKEICRLLKLSETEYVNKIADFFQSLTTSKEFILLEDGNWDLKNNYSIKIEMDKIYDDNSQEEIEEEDENSKIEEIDDLDSLDKSNILDDNSNDDLSDLTIIDEDDLEE